MLSKIEIYGLILAGLILAFIGAEFHGRHIGAEQARAEAAKEVLAANTKADAATAKLQQVSEDKDREWQTHIDALGSRVDNLKRSNGTIRLCRNPDSGKLSPDGTPPAIAGAAPGGSGHDLQVGPDIRGSVLLFGAECERYREQVISLQDFAKEQKRLIDAALSGR